MTSHPFSLPDELETHTIWSQFEAQSIDQQSIERHGIPLSHLMQQAAEGLFKVIMSQHKLGFRYLIFCGKGGNGGDALILANLLHKHQIPVCAFSGSGKAEERPFPKPTRGLDLRPITDLNLSAFVREKTVVVDGCFGIGITRPLTGGPWADALSQIRQWQPAYVIAVDVPSGLHPDSIDDDFAPILPANTTITFGRKKPCHVMSPSRTLCGDVIVVPVDFSPQAIRDVESHHTIRQVRVKPGQIPRIWSKLSKDLHKYQRGHVLIIGGSVGKTGAPILSAKACAKAGAGWTSLSLPDRAQHTPPFIVREDFFDARGHLKEDDIFNHILSRKVRVLVIGPGMSQSLLTEAFLSELARICDEQDLKVILDAGAIHGIGGSLGGKLPKSRFLLTPHPGEAIKSQLVCATPKSLKDLQKLKNKCETHGLDIFYKTATPIMLGSESNTPNLLISESAPILGQAGSGDVLVGVTAAIAAAGLPLSTSVVIAQLLLVQAAYRTLQVCKGGHGTIEDIINQIVVH
ncbi:MAG: NAD(P)H-hydrate epimerase [Pseudobacteriovorax sp.]|nr:NAD(P)H-hydrate epimerase [Pseudobacteriovorax sp.]